MSGQAEQRPVYFRREKPVGRDTLRVDLSDFEGKTYLGIRKWFTNAAGEITPGKGITLQPRDLPWLLTQLEAATEEALQLGLVTRREFPRDG